MKQNFSYFIHSDRIKLFVKCFILKYYNYSILIFFSTNVFIHFVVLLGDTARPSYKTLLKIHNIILFYNTKLIIKSAKIKNVVKQQPIRFHTKHKLQRETSSFAGVFC